jgi:serine/threonine protein kinase
MATAPESHGGMEARDVSSRVGSVVDKYAIVRLLGKGGMGAVYEARHVALMRRVAVKFLLPELARNRELRHRFENEAKAAGRLEHQNVTAMTDFGVAPDGSPYLVMEFLHGEDCSKLIRRQGPLPVARVADIVTQACRGLSAAHRAQIIHRDLKPENLFLTRAGDGRDLVKVLDFGIAKLRLADGSFTTGTGAIFGTAHYMSPEQARGSSDVDGRTDVWALGAVLYELLSARKAFQGDQFLAVIDHILNRPPDALETLRPDLPPALVDLVGRALTKSAAERLASVEALAEKLAPFVADRHPVPAAPLTPTTREDIAARPGRRPVRVARFVAIGLAAATGLLAAHHLRAARPAERGNSGASATTARPSTAAGPSAPGAPRVDVAATSAVFEQRANIAPQPPSDPERAPRTAPKAVKKAAIARAASPLLPATRPPAAQPSGRPVKIDEDLYGGGH